MFKLKNIIWAAITILILFTVYSSTDPANLHDINLAYFAGACASFLISIIFWTAAWHLLMKTTFTKSLKINIKALTGFFSPMGLGGDFLRYYFAGKEKMSGPHALSASFIVKFYKFLIIFFYLLLAIYLLAPLSVDFPQHAAVFISALIVTMLGAIIVLMFRFRKVTNFFYRLLNRISIIRFHESLSKQFIEMSTKTAVSIIILLIISTVFEVLAVYAAFLAINYELTLIHIFIFAAVIHSLALITITPQGVGFVEAGGYFMLSMGFYSVPESVIGSFLIIWNLIRVWIPSLIGLLATFFDAHLKRGKND